MTSFHRSGLGTVSSFRRSAAPEELWMRRLHAISRTDRYCFVPVGQNDPPYRFGFDSKCSVTKRAEHPGWGNI